MSNIMNTWYTTKDGSRTAEHSVKYNTVTVIENGKIIATVDVAADVTPGEVWDIIKNASAEETTMDATETRSQFENKAYTGYIGYGTSMTDGYYAPMPLDHFVAGLHRMVPVSPRSLRYSQNDFCPTQEECDAYNATFHTGQVSWADVTTS